MQQSINMFLVKKSLVLHNQSKSKNLSPLVSLKTLVKLYNLTIKVSIYCLLRFNQLGYFGNKYFFSSSLFNSKLPKLMFQLLTKLMLLYPVIYCLLFTIFFSNLRPTPPTKLIINYAASYSCIYSCNKGNIITFCIKDH